MQNNANNIPILPAVPQLVADIIQHQIGAAIPPPSIPPPTVLDFDENSFHAPFFFERVCDIVWNKNSILFEPSDIQRDRLGVHMTEKYIGEIQKGAPNGGKNTIYLMTSVEQLGRRARFMYMVCGYNIIYFADETTHDVSTKESWETHLENYEVLFLTAERFFNALRSKLLDITYANTVIIDSDALLIDDDIYQIFKKFVETTPAASRPRFLLMCGNYPPESLVEHRDRLDELKTIMNGVLLVTKEAEEGVPAFGYD